MIKKKKLSSWVIWGFKDMRYGKENIFLSSGICMVAVDGVYTLSC